MHPAGRPAQTEYEVLEAFQTGSRSWSWLRIRPRQGRLHQIRVHLAHAGHPVAADPLYGSGAVLRAEDLGGQGPETVLARLALHAVRLVFPHVERPSERVSVEAPLPDDLAHVCALLRAAAVRSPDSEPRP